MRLDVLLDDTTVPAIEIDALTLDSRAAAPGTAFVALAGASTHGLRHASQAVAAGASCVLFEPPAPNDIVLPQAAVAVPALRARLGGLADRFFDAPSKALTLVGVTGTNGKTSTVQLLAQAFANAGFVSGSIGTLGTGLHGAIVAGERTTPDVIAVHGDLARMRDAGASHVAMEVSSHALHQGRVDAVDFDVAVFTNLTRDHLDYHGDMASYGAAKALLFAWPGLDVAVVNIDDAFGRTLAAGDEAPRRITLSSRGADATLRAEAIVPNAAGLHFDLVLDGVSVPVQSRLLGRFNVDNLLAVAGTLLALDWTLADIAAALAQLEPVPGRMARLGGDAATPLVVVDYAHTPDALEQALSTLRSHTAGRLLCVFGCGGERDRGKRPQMARIAETGSDLVIVTDDNPRRESGDAIVAEIVEGFSSATRIVAATDLSSADIVEGTLLPRSGGSCRQAEGGTPTTPTAILDRDRSHAIALAIALATAGDTVLIAGKGHEPYQDIDGIKHPFDDLAHARTALEARA